MADVEEAFTQRILHRASLRRNRDGNKSLNSSNEISQRRHNILKAIGEPSYRRRTSVGIHDSQSFDQSSDVSRNSFNLTGIPCDNNNDANAFNAYKNIDVDSKKDAKYNKFFELGKVISSEPLRNKLHTGNAVQTKTSSLIGEDNSEERPSESRPKIMKDNIKPSRKSQAVLKASENKIADTILDINLTQAPQSLTSSLVFIEDSDAETEKQNPRTKKTFTTAAVIEMCNRVYAAMELNCETSDVKELKIIEDISTRNFKNITEDSSCLEKLVNDETDMRKLLPSTEPHVEPKSDDSEKCEEMASVQSDATSYDAEKFLIEALGEKLDNTINYDDTLPYNGIESNSTANDEATEVSSQLQKKVMAALNLSMSESLSPRNSSTLNKSMRIYNSVSQRIKKRFRPSVKTKRDEEIDPTMSSGSEEIDMIQDLLHEIKAQQTLMNEAAKTLHFFDKKKYVLSVSERVETEGLLLLASLRRKAALDEIKNITSDEIKESASFRERGEVTVSDISLDLRYRLHSQLRNNEIEWFIVAVSQGLNVWITPAICGSTNDSGKLKFSDSTSIPNLTPGFKINVQVYSLRVRSDDCDDDDNSRIHRQSRGTSCLPYSNILASPTKFLKKIKSPGSPTNNYSNAWKSRDSAFVLSGLTEFTLQDLSSSSPWSLKRVPTNSTLNGQIHLNLACRLHFTMSHQGFLNYYEEIGGFGNWNRRWCVLKGHELMFWNYPLEQDVKEPLKIIEMMSCVSNEITTVDKSICPRSRTLLIETSRSRNSEDKDSMIVECTSTSTYVRHLLSYDSAQELNEWAEKLNHVLFALEEWHVIEQRTHAQITDL